MTVNIAIATADGYITSSNSSYTNAKNGATTTVDTGAPTLIYGQLFSASTYFLYQSFLKFPYVLEADAYIPYAWFELRHYNSLGSPGRTLQIREYDWTTLAAADWRTPTELSAATLLGYVEDAENWSGGWARATTRHLQATRVFQAGEIGVVVCTNRQVSETLPSGEERGSVHSLDGPEISYDPRMVWCTIPRNTLHRVLGAQVQLPDTTWMYLESDGDRDDPVITMKHTDGTTVTTVATIPTKTVDDGTFEFMMTEAAQNIAMTCDDEGNIYLIGKAGQTDLMAVGYLKTGPTTWVRQTRWRVGVVSSVMEQWTIAWHNWKTADLPRGVLVAFSGRQAANTTGLMHEDPFYHILDPQGLVGSAALLLLSNGDNVEFTEVTSSSDFVNYINPTGSGLDAVSLPHDPLLGRIGYVVTYSRGKTSIGRYLLSSDGRTLTADHDSGDDHHLKDGASKYRVVPIDDRVFAESAGEYPFDVWQWNAQGTFTNLGYESALSLSQTMTTFPDEDDLDTSSTWDIVYVPDQHKLWFYYFDVADNHRLMRTAFNMDTYSAERDEQEVGFFGAVGSTNLALRVSRNPMVGGTNSQVLLSIANVSSGGVHSTLYAYDSANRPPEAPSLITKNNFDATQSAQFDWIFNDPNLGDMQSAFQLQIVRVSDQVVVHDTLKTLSETMSYVLPASTLTNGVDYQWRVSTWDAVDAAGPYSTYGTFNTAEGGTVTITDPATDNPPDIITDNYLVQWSLTGATQDEYRVIVRATSDSSVLLDTSWVLSSATSHEITGMLSDVEYEIEVTTRSAGIASNPGFRLITSSYAIPPTPEMTLTAQPNEGHILVEVMNPTPAGDVLQVTKNEIFRRSAEEALYTKVGETPVDSSFKDYTAASGVTYEYFVRGVSPSGQAESAPLQATLNLSGLWIHYPGDPEGTTSQYPYSGESRKFGMEVEQEGTFYAGRRYPVVDFGETQDETLEAEVAIVNNDEEQPNAATRHSLLQFAQGRKPVFVRDGRGRAFTGIIHGYEEASTFYGWNVAFSVRRVDTAPVV